MGPDPRQVRSIRSSRIAQALNALQQPVTQAAIETFDKAILLGLAGVDLVPINVVITSSF